MVSDLATRHEPLTELFPRLASAAAGPHYRLSDDQVRCFHEQGYLAPVRILDDVQLEALRAELQALVDPAHPGHALFYEFHTNESSDPSRILFHALGAWRIGEAFHDLLWHPAFTVPAAQLLGGRVRFWHDQVFCKPARHGGVVAWHQDYSYWTRTEPMAHLTCWIGLDDSTRDNGCLQYVPGSHRWGLLPKPALAGDIDGIRAVLTAEQHSQFNPVAIELKQGEASFHHPLLLHGSYENRTEHPRRAAVINVFRDGVRSASDEPPLQGVSPVPKGQKMDGPFFPLLSSFLDS
jgi:ectoine hydroxylase-related dioxygenase (phytanoyl-CoA dioxygenase family)